jgi:hypothetical protein
MRSEWNAAISAKQREFDALIRVAKSGARLPSVGGAPVQEPNPWVAQFTSGGGMAPGGIFGGQHQPQPAAPAALFGTASGGVFGGGAAAPFSAPAAATVFGVLQQPMFGAGAAQTTKPNPFGSVVQQPAFGGGGGGVFGAPAPIAQFGVPAAAAPGMLFGQPQAPSQPAASFGAAPAPAAAPNPFGANPSAAQQQLVSSAATGAAVGVATTNGSGGPGAGGAPQDVYQQPAFVRGKVRGWEFAAIDCHNLRSASCLLPPYHMLPLYHCSQIPDDPPPAALCY